MLGYLARIGDGTRAATGSLLSQEHVMTSDTTAAARAHFCSANDLDAPEFFHLRVKAVRPSHQTLPPIAKMKT